MRITIIGAGAMGNLFGGYLSLENEVYMIDVNKHIIDSINHNGINIFEKKLQRTINYKVQALIDTSNIGEMDLVIMFVKNIYTISALESNRSLFGENTLVMSLQNGAGNDRDLEKFIKKENILIGTTEHNCRNLGEGKISHDAIGVTNIGMIIYNEEKLSKIEKVFKECNIETKIYENIQEIIWRKLFINMSLNSITAILRCKVGYIYDSKYATHILENILSEAVDVAIADGMDFNKDEIIKNIQKHIHEDFYEIITSMNQDVSNKRETEIDHINGAVVKAGKEYGIPTPYNEFVVNIIHAIEGLY
ncbi:2-dehydropantoate 2-reductase [Clostridium sp. SHJSY1]|uniref:ketopantoate reductase family protein n=1 Tax=Clostridium sp. SHJSY1 TaxID=2942483 RepID=UPI0028752F7A|nr:2-dehydropantoate 2-reductase [Clostridium sp. SHJSY1]MDS0525993.1 2-dehydropantoate 2-reductase [Clostridium sp. SHJSY1]